MSDKRKSIQIDEELHWDIKLLAIQKKMTIKQLLKELVEKEKAGSK